MPRTDLLLRLKRESNVNRSKENIWRHLQGLPLHRPMKEVVAKLKHYIETYDQQHGYEDYTDDQFIDDLIYGIGTSLSAEYQFADGARNFEERLRKHIEKRQLDYIRRHKNMKALTQ